MSEPIAYIAIMLAYQMGLISLSERELGNISATLQLAAIRALTSR